MIGCRRDRRRTACTLSIVAPRLFTVLVTGTVTPATMTLWFQPLSSSGTNDAGFGFVWIQAKPDGVHFQTAMDGLETVADDAECLVSAESDV